MKFLIYVFVFGFYCQIAAMQEPNQPQPLECVGYIRERRIMATNNPNSEIVIEFFDTTIYKKPRKPQNCLALKKSCLGCMKLLLECLFPTNENNKRED